MERRCVFEAHWWCEFAQFEVSAMKPKFSTNLHWLILTFCCCMRLCLELHGIGHHSWGLPWCSKIVAGLQVWFGFFLPRCINTTMPKACILWYLPFVVAIARYSPTVVKCGSRSNELSQLCRALLTPYIILCIASDFAAGSDCAPVRCMLKWKQNC